MAYEEGHGAAARPCRCRPDSRGLRSGRRMMPIRKYRSVTDMPGVRPLRPLDPDNLRIACELTELSFALHPWRFEPGVRKFRSLAEANQHRQEWEKKQVRSPL